MNTKQKNNHKISFWCYILTLLLSHTSISASAIEDAPLNDKTKEQQIAFKLFQNIKYATFKYYDDRHHAKHSGKKYGTTKKGRKDLHDFFAHAYVQVSPYSDNFKKLKSKFKKIKVYTYETDYDNDDLKIDDDDEYNKPKKKYVYLNMIALSDIFKILCNVYTFEQMTSKSNKPDPLTTKPYKNLNEAEEAGIDPSDYVVASNHLRNIIKNNSEFARFYYNKKSEDFQNSFKLLFPNEILSWVPEESSTEYKERLESENLKHVTISTIGDALLHLNYEMDREDKLELLDREMEEILDDEGASNEEGYDFTTVAALAGTAGAVAAVASAVNSGGDDLDDDDLDDNQIAPQ